MLKLYANPISPYAQRLMFFLEETQIPHEYIMLRTVDLETPTFLKASSFKTVPAIEVNGFTMTESLAILRFLAQRYQMFSWYPIGLEERARVDQIIEFGESIMRPLMALGKEIAMAPQIGKQTNRDRVEHLKEELARYLPRFEDYITNRTFAAGPTPTIADAAFAPFLHMYRYADLSMLDFPETKAYADRMIERPAMKTVLIAVAEAYRAHAQKK